MGNSLTGDAAQITHAQLATFYRDGSWIESRSIDQLTQVSTWPGMLHVAAFPDLHPGRHGPVGAAFLADRLYPQLVGPDIGCGMALFRLSLPRRKLKLEKATRRLTCLDDALPQQEADTALEEAGLGGLSPYGLGTIGGGNHFLELQEASDICSGSTTSLASGDLCLLVHTGSRSLGAGIFTSLEERWNEGFEAGSDAALRYLDLHDKAVAWAALNRRLLAARAAEALRCDVELICDAPHNLVTAERGGWLHRKGAAAPDRGLAPLAGSRDDVSFLVSSLAGDEALGSLSHGAGRRYDRSAMHGRIARTRSGMEAMSRNRFGGHVVCADRDLLIEEAGPAYKDAASVLADLEAHGIAERRATLTPLLTFKTSMRKEDRS